MEEKVRAFIKNGWDKDMDTVEFEAFLNYTYQLYEYWSSEIPVERVETDFNISDCDEILGEGTELMGSASFYGFQLDILTRSELMRLTKSMDTLLFDALLSVELVVDKSDIQQNSEDIYNEIYNALASIDGIDSSKEDLKNAILEVQSMRAAEEIWNDKSKASPNTVSVDDSVLVLDDISFEPDYDQDFIIEFFVRKILNQLEEDAAYKYIVVSPNIENYGYKQNSCLAKDKEAYINFWESLGFKRTEGHLKEGFCLVKDISNS